MVCFLNFLIQSGTRSEENGGRGRGRGDEAGPEAGEGTHFSANTMTYDSFGAYVGRCIIK